MLWRHKTNNSCCRDDSVNIRIAGLSSLSSNSGSSLLVGGGVCADGTLPPPSSRPLQPHSHIRSASNQAAVVVVVAPARKCGTQHTALRRDLPFFFLSVPLLGTSWLILPVTRDPVPQERYVHNISTAVHMCIPVEN